MRTTLVVLLWLVATAGVVYVANAAVELVDLQVFPGGSRIEVLSLPGADSPPSTSSPQAQTSRMATTTAATTTVPEEAAGTTTSTTTTSTTTLSPSPTTVAEIEEIPEEIPEEIREEVPEEAPEELPEELPEETPEETPEVVVSTTTLVAATSTTTVAPATTTVAPATTTTLLSAVTTTIPELVVLTAALPEARIGENYRAELLVSGGTPPYVWSLPEGSLPAGVDFSPGGVLSGVAAEETDTSLLFRVTDGAGRWADSTRLLFATTPDRRTVVARGGTVFIDNKGDSVSLFLVSPADGYSAVIVEPGGFRVEVQFVPIQGDATSWVVCEVNAGVVCTNG